MASPIKKTALPPYIPLKKRIFRGVMKIIKYPRMMVKKYMAYNAGLGEILNEIEDPYVFELRKKNNYLVNLAIHGPFFIGLVLSIASLYLHHQDFELYIHKAFSTVHTTGFFNSIAQYFRRMIYILTEIPLKPLDYIPFIGGYLFSVLGAFILSFHPGFQEADRITHIFSTLGYIDSEGKPWKVVWTPNAIMIEAFNCDPKALSENKRFWSTVNFPPSAPNIVPGKMNKFIVQRKYELPTSLVFEYKGEDNG